MWTAIDANLSQETATASTTATVEGEVAATNTKTLADCQRFLAAASDKFICENDAGEVVNDEVAAHLRKLAEQKR